MMNNPFMYRYCVEYKYYPLFDAYCRNRGLIFWLAGGGFKRGFSMNKRDYVEYNIWIGDKDFMRLMMEELPF